MERAASGVAVPASVIRATWTLVAIVAMSGVTTLLTVLFRDDLIRSWAQRNDNASQILAEEGLEALKESPLLPSFVPVAIVSFITYAALAYVLGMLVRGGHGWARLALSATILFAVFLAVLGLGRDLPAIFVVVSVLSLILYGVLAFFLWHKDTTAYLRAV